MVLTKFLVERVTTFLTVTSAEIKYMVDLGMIKFAVVLIMTMVIYDYEPN